MKKPIINTKTTSEETTETTLATPAEEGKKPLPKPNEEVK